jgi:hypothetical protein
MTAPLEFPYRAPFLTLKLHHVLTRGEMGADSLLNLLQLP